MFANRQLACLCVLGTLKEIHRICTDTTPPDFSSYSQIPESGRLEFQQTLSQELNALVKSVAGLSSLIKQLAPAARLLKSVADCQELWQKTVNPEIEGLTGVLTDFDKGQDISEHVEQLAAFQETWREWLNRINQCIESASQELMSTFDDDLSQ